MKTYITKLLNWRIFRYLVAGGSAVAVNLGFLYILVHFFHMWYLVSAVISFTAAVYASFMLQKYFTFNDRSQDTMRRQMSLYLTLQVINLGLNTLFMYICVDLFKILYLTSQILIAVVMAISNFFVYRYLVFTPDAAYNKTQ